MQPHRTMAIDNPSMTGGPAGGHIAAADRSSTRANEGLRLARHQLVVAQHRFLPQTVQRRQITLTGDQHRVPRPSSRNAASQHA